MAIQGAARDTVIDSIRHKEWFGAGGQTNGTRNFRGEERDPRSFYSIEFSPLSSETRKIFYEDQSNITYVVWSYSTPIAWYVKAEDRWVIVDEKFSTTTSSHQNIVRQALV